MLAGPEVKSLRDGRGNLQEAYARVEDGEVWLHGMHISPYAYSRTELDPVRKRKLLLHHKEIVELATRHRTRRATRSCRCGSTSRTAGPRSSSRSLAASGRTTSARRSPNATPSARPSAR